MKTDSHTHCANCEANYSYVEQGGKESISSLGDFSFFVICATGWQLWKHCKLSPHIPLIFLNDILRFTKSFMEDPKTLSPF